MLGLTKALHLVIRHSHHRSETKHSNVRTRRRAIPSRRKHFSSLHCFLDEIFSNLDVSNIYLTNHTISIFLGLSSLKLFALASIIIIKLYFIL